MILDGKTCSEQRLKILHKVISESGIRPQLATVIAGDDPASKMYVRMKHRACERVGIRSVGIDLPGNVTTGDVVAAVRRLNEDPQIDGILVQLPLPPQLDTKKVIAAVSPDKDVDGFHPCNLGLLFAGTPRFAPCTPLGVMTLLGANRIPVSGKHAVVLGRSIDVGRPMAALLLSADATVTVCHSRTPGLAGIARQADILVSSVGKAMFVTADMVKPGAVVVDVGINDLDGKLVGDVDFAAVSPIASAITPVPGGVGPMTIATLMENTFRAAQERSCGSAP